MKLSIVIPVYNEQDTLLTIISKIRNVDTGEVQKEILVVDDCSTDSTRMALQNMNFPEVKVYYHEINHGKGAAIRTGIQHATGELILIQDADLEYDPTEYPKLLKPILDNKADVVYGSRFQGSGSHRVLYFWHYLGNRFLTLASNVFTNLNLTDMETCYKIFRASVIKNIEIEENRFGFEPEITAKVARRGCRIYEVGISYFGRTFSEGKKINWRDGFRAIFAILKYGFFYRFEFFKQLMPQKALAYASIVWILFVNALFYYFLVLREVPVFERFFLKFFTALR